MTTTTTTPTTTSTGSTRTPKKRTRSPIAPYVFVAPAVVLYIAFLLVPMLYSIYLSFRGMRLVSGGAFGKRKSVFIGFENYISALTDPEFIAGFGRLAIYGAIAIPLTLGLALLFALLLDLGATRAKRFSRTSIFIPYAVPGVVATLMWGFMYLPLTSPFSYITRELGWGTIPFLEDPWIFGSVANIAIWGGVGFNMIIIYTSLRGIPSELYDAARIDGANEWQIAMRVKVPLVTPALVLTGLFAVIGTLQVYGEPTTLRPMTSAISQTWVPLMTIYRDAFVRDDLPRAAASSVFLAVITVVMSVILLRLTQKRAFGGES